MKIIELRASNFARLRAVEIRPSGPLVPITGKNEAGKTTVLRSIWTALKGRAVAPARPVREGTEEATIQLDLGELKITRRFRQTAEGEVTDSLSVTNAEGDRVRRSPQAMIDALLGDLSFDPLQFARMKPRDQYARLKALVSGIDFERIAEERLEAFRRRTDVNRRAKERETLAERTALPEGPEPEAINLGDLVRELGEVTKKNSNHIVGMAQVVDHRNRAARFEQEAKRLREQAAEAERRAANDRLDADEIETSLPAKIDTAPLQARIASAEQVNATRAKFEARRQHEREAEASRLESGRITARIADLDEQVAAAIAGAKLPAGLSLDILTETVMLGGYAFADAATSVRIGASAQVAMALNPELRVMLIDEGSELDREHLAALEQIAGERDYQIWIARVEEGEGGSGFRIEDGATAEAVAGVVRVPAAALDRAKEKRR